MKINVLPSSIFNLIAAGEVVERPSSVVKELVENAIDANASNVKIEIIGGGIEKIKITDNGSGIDREDVKTAFLPHATSKISAADDLECITTLGFRGEALASIASVAMVNIGTKTADNDTGTTLDIRGGVFGEEGECVMLTGTSITVSNLFFNTPARIKFLKRPKTEESYVTEVVTNLCFANPYVAFEYVVEGKLQYKTDGKGLKSAIDAVYNREIAMNFAAIENTDGICALTGFVSKPTYTRPNRSYQNVMLNGRNVQNKTVISAVEKAYESFTMTRAYPMFVLNLTVPYDEVDVNVHPGKADVRFSDSGKIFGFVYKSVLNFLLSYNEVAAFTSTDEVKAEQVVLKDQPQVTEAPHSEMPQSRQNPTINLSSLLERKPAPAMRSDSGVGYEVRKRLIEEAAEEQKAASKELFGEEITIVGQLFSTYIIAEKGEHAYFIDQHAVAERLLYDKLNGKSGETVIQPLLLPYVFDVNNKEEAYLSEVLDDLNGIGIEIEAFGKQCFKVSALPIELAELNLERFFQSVLKDLSAPNVSKTKEILSDKLKQAACKAAIKGGDVLTTDQIKGLLKSIDGAEKVPLQCPHGRPAIIKFDKTEVEKWFKRIV